MRFSNFLNKALMGKQIMHSARALFLTFLAPEKSKRNTILYKNYATAKLREGWQKIYSESGDICASALKHTPPYQKNTQNKFQTKSIALNYI